MHFTSGLRCSLLQLVFLLGAGIGCSRAPERELQAVVGRVMIGGVPAAHGTVSFRPLDARQGHQPTGGVNAAGEYVLHTSGQTGAPPGEYRVLVFMHEQAPAVGAHPGLPKSLIDPRYQDPASSPLHVSVVANPAPGAYDLEIPHAR
jgi:hypothetical protein